MRREQIYLDADGNKTDPWNAVEVITRIYDSDGRLIERTLNSVDHQISNNSQGRYGEVRQAPLHNVKQKGLNKDSWVCPNDETINYGEYCVVCGQERIMPNSLQHPDNEKSIGNRKNKKSWVVVVWITLLILALVALIWLIWLSRDKAEELPENVPSVSTQPVMEVQQETDAPTIVETKHAHIWQDASCTQPKTCSACGETEGTVLSHIWAEATRYAPKTCTLCGQTDGDAIAVYSMRNVDNLENLQPEKWEDQNFWGQKSYKRNDVYQVVFSSDLYAAPGSAWDMSAEHNGTIKAWMDNGRLTIAANGIIELPWDSSYLFAGFVNLQEINWAGMVDSSHVNNMLRMFSNCKSLRGIDLSKFDTANVTDMGHMFASCLSLQNLDTASFDTRNVTNMKCMFFECSELTTLDLSGFNTENVVSMENMFGECVRLMEVNVRSFNTSRVKDFSHMFQHCISLRNVYVSGFDMSRAEYINSMFFQCRNLTTVDFSNFDLSHIMGMVYVLAESGVKNITAKNWNVPKGAVHSNFMDSDGMINGMPWKEYFK